LGEFNLLVRARTQKTAGQEKHPVSQNAAVSTLVDSTESADRNAFEAALAASLPANKRPNEGDIVSGVIASITPDVVLVSIGGKSEALMALDELEGEKVGDAIEAVVIKASPEIRLSRKLAAAKRAKTELRAAAAAQIPVVGKVLSRNKGGFEVAVGGAGGPRAFCPVSQIDMGRHDEASLQDFVGKSFDFRVIEYSEDGKRVVVSRAALLKEVQDQELAKVREQITPGAIFTGKVRSITDFGAFVDLGGIDGLVHVTEISRRRVAHAKDALTVGQEVQVKVIKIENEGKRISLSMKDFEKDPWDDISTRLASGAPFTGKIARHADFGIFVELEPGIDGLIHVSQLPPGASLKDEAFAPGQTVTGWIRELDPSSKRLSLTLREVPDSDPWDGIHEKMPDGSVMQGEVDNVATFGVFVRLPNGLTGLVPNSETGLPHGTPATRTFNPGQKIEVKVIGLDVTRRRISLSVSGAREEADRAEVRKYREDNQRREKGDSPRMSTFGASLLAALSNPKKESKKK
jgi:small subunit ribosomal protein S1